MKGALSGAMKGALSGAVKGDLSGTMAIAPASLTVTSELPSIVAAFATATTTAYAWCSSAVATPMTPTLRYEEPVMLRCLPFLAGGRGEVVPMGLAGVPTAKGRGESSRALQGRRPTASATGVGRRTEQRHRSRTGERRCGLPCWRRASSRRSRTHRTTPTPSVDRCPRRPTAGGRGEGW